MTRLALLGALLLSGCVTVGHHQRKLTEMRQEDYEYAAKLAQDVQLQKLRPQDMVGRLKWRYRMQVQDEVAP